MKNYDYACHGCGEAQTYVADDACLAAVYGMATGLDVRTRCPDCSTINRVGDGITDHAVGTDAVTKLGDKASTVDYFRNDRGEKNVKPTKSRRKSGNDGR